MTIKINTIGIIAKDKSDAVKNTVNKLVAFLTENPALLFLIKALKI